MTEKNRKRLSEHYHESGMNNPYVNELGSKKGKKKELEDLPKIEDQDPNKSGNGEGKNA